MRSLREYVSRWGVVASAAGIAFCVLLVVTRVLRPPRGETKRIELPMQRYEISLWAPKGYEAHQEGGYMARLERRLIVGEDDDNTGVVTLFAWSDMSSPRCTGKGVASHVSYFDHSRVSEEAGGARVEMFWCAKDHNSDPTGFELYVHTPSRYVVECSVMWPKDSLPSSDEFDQGAAICWSLHLRRSGYDTRY